MAGGAVILGFLGVVAAQFSYILASFFMVPAGFLTALVQGGASLLGGIPGSFLWVAQPGIWAVIAAYAGMALLWGESLRPGIVNQDPVDSGKGMAGNIFRGIIRYRPIMGLGLIVISQILVIGRSEIPCTPGGIRMWGQETRFLSTPRIYRSGGWWRV